MSQLSLPKGVYYFLLNPTMRLFLALVLSLIPLSVSAAYYYVSPSGNDNATGTETKPFKTFAKALSLQGPGVTITLQPGVYREGNLTLDGGGTKESPFIIEGVSPSQTFIKGSDEISQWSLYNGNIWKKENWPVNSQQVFSDGEILQQIGAGSHYHQQIIWGTTTALPAVGAGIQDMTAGSFYYDKNDGTLYVWLKDNKDPNDHLMEASTKDWILRGVNSAHVTIRNLTMAHTTGTRKSFKGRILTVGYDNWTLENCTLEYGDFACLTGIGKNHTIKDCIIRYGGDVGIDMANTDAAHNWSFYQTAPSMNIVVDNCVISNNNYRKFVPAWHSGGLKLIPGIRGYTVKNCTVENNQGPGIWFDHPIGENVIENNYVSNNEQGIFYEISSDGGIMSFGAKICNNTVVNSSYQGIYVSASSNVEVTNNTVVNAWAGVVLHGMPRGNFELKNNLVEDNVILGGDVGELILYEGNLAGNNQLTRNFYVTGVPTTPGGAIRSEPRIGIVTGKGYSINYKDLNKLYNERGYEKEGLSGNPNWENMNEINYSLGGGSPAVGMGATENCCCVSEGGSGISFPVEWYGIWAEPDPIHQKIELHWQTASEQGNNFFTIERSKDGILFLPFEDVPSYGDSRIQQSYSVVDDQPFSGTAFYRIKQTDLDGTFSFSPIIETSLELPSLPFSMSVFPVPVKVGSPLRVEVQMQDINSPMTLHLFTLGGKEIGRYPLNKGSNSQTLQIDTSGLNIGRYLLTSKEHPTATKQILLTD